MVSKEERQDVEKEYAELSKKYSMPSLEEIEKELCIKIIGTPVLTSLINAFREILGGSVSHFEAIISPARMADMIETKFHDEKEKKEMFKMYKILLAILHEISATFYGTEKDRAEIIKKTFEFYKKEYKQYTHQFLQKQGSLWRQEAEKEPPKPQTQQGNYFG